jgi:hypothetical protein
LSDGAQETMSALIDGPLSDLQSDENLIKDDLSVDKDALLKAAEDMISKINNDDGLSDKDK